MLQKPDLAVAGHGYALMIKAICLFAQRQIKITR